MNNRLALTIIIPFLVFFLALIFWDFYFNVPKNKGLSLNDKLLQEKTVVKVISEEKTGKELKEIVGRVESMSIGKDTGFVTVKLRKYDNNYHLLLNTKIIVSSWDKDDERLVNGAELIEWYNTRKSSVWAEFYSNDHVTLAIFIGRGVDNE